MNGAPSDLDPHSVYDYRSVRLLRGSHESLIALDGCATDRYVPVIAESWQPNDAYNLLYPQIACDQWGAAGANGGYYCNERVQKLFEANRDEPDPEKDQAALSEIQQIIARDDPPAIYYMQRQWTTILRADIAGFVFNPINIGTFNFYTMSRRS